MTVVPAFVCEQCELRFTVLAGRALDACPQCSGPIRRTPDGERVEIEDGK